MLKGNTSPNRNGQLNTQKLKQSMKNNAHRSIMAIKTFKLHEIRKIIQKKRGNQIK